MELTAFQSVMDALNRHEVRYLLAGGMAVVAHGYGRMTYDLDLVVQLTETNILSTFSALQELGYKPRVPVTAQQFADEEIRNGWIREKGMTVLNLHSDKHRTTPVDLFVTEPFDFEATYETAVKSEVDGVEFRYVDLKTLIQMKEAAGRPRDIEDIRNLRLIIRDEEQETSS